MILSNDSSDVWVGSWNMGCFNKDPKEAFRFVTDWLEARDIVALQEVPAAFREKLNGLSQQVRMHACTELFLEDKKTKKRLPRYSVILTKRELLEAGHINLPFQPRRWPMQAKALDWVSTATKLQRIRNFEDDHQAQYVVVEVGGRRVRVLNAHLTFWRPSWRTQELNELLAHLDPECENIVCGDLNCFESDDKPWVSPLFSWLTGENSFYRQRIYSERNEMEYAFDRHGLVNHLRGKTTYCGFGGRLGKLQFDHILIPKTAELKRSNVYRYAYGSDHYPIEMKIRFN